MLDSYLGNISGTFFTYLTIIISSRDKFNFTEITTRSLLMDFHLSSRVVAVTTTADLIRIA